MQQEILVILRSTFADGQLKNIDDAENKKLSPEQTLEDACANGSLQEFLPEIFKDAQHHNVHLWEMHPGFSFLQLEFGEAPLNIDVRHSIDPHNFLFTKCYN